MKLLSTAAVLSVIAAVVSARDCPLESDCIQKSCKNFRLPSLPDGFMKFGGTWELTADCKDNAGKKTVTKLYLEQCLAKLGWNPDLGPWVEGNFGCNSCELTKTDPLMMACWCKNKRGGGQAQQINLSEGIWVYDGAIGCYQTGLGSMIRDIHKTESPGGLRKSPGIGDY